MRKVGRETLPVQPSDGTTQVFAFGNTPTPPRGVHTSIIPVSIIPVV